MNLTLYALAVVPCAAVWTLLSKLVPAMTLARFQRVVAEVRDECEDLQFAGTLPLEECVTQFVARADLLSRHAQGFTLINALCAHSAAQDARYEPPEKSTSYAELGPDQRRIMHALDGRLQKAVKRYLLAGSVTGWVVGCLLFVASLQRAVRKRLRLKAPSVRRLTVDFEEVASNWDEQPKRRPGPRIALQH